MTGEQTLVLDLGPESLQYLYRQLAAHKRLTVTRADLVLESESGGFDVRLTPPGGARVDAPTATGGDFGEHHQAPTSWAAGEQGLLGTWSLQLKRTPDMTWDQLPEDAIDRAWLLLQFGV